MSINVAVAQLGSTKHSIAENLASVLDVLQQASAQGNDLVVFPECILTSYMYDSADEVRENTLDLQSPEIKQVIAVHEELKMYSVIGLLERDGDEIYNSSILVGPEGLIGVYRKQHLPTMGADRFVTEGPAEQPRVWDTTIGRIGMMICFDIRFPESARELALKRADIIALPTNWAVQSRVLADLFTKVRATENLVYLAVSNRNDREPETTFLGHSQIVSPLGEELINAGTQSGVFSSRIDVNLARNKSLVIEEGRFELPIFSARRPDSYSLITDIHQ